ncbi:Hypothetical protein A7982_00897 [Minicystis rosea]|nr:Hypothetical protein A7982_00897 [Minicystis rosea]
MDLHALALSARRPEAHPHSSAPTRWISAEIGIQSQPEVIPLLDEGCPV